MITRYQESVQLIREDQAKPIDDAARPDHLHCWIKQPEVRMQSFVFSFRVYIVEPLSPRTFILRSNEVL